MIPASYLFKDVYRGRWGKDFERQAGEPWAPERSRPTLNAVADVFGHRAGAAPTRR